MERAKRGQALPDIPDIEDPAAAMTAAAAAAALADDKPARPAQLARTHITLAPGQADGQFVPVQLAGSGTGQRFAYFPTRGRHDVIVPDDATEGGLQAVSESLAASLVERGLCVYTAGPEAEGS